MTEPTKPRGTPKPRTTGGKKNDPSPPPAGQSIEGGEGSQPGSSPELKDKLHRQEKNHNDIIDRGDSKNAGQTQESIEADPWWKRSASILNASPLREHVTQHTFIAWQRQVLFDRSLNLYARTILSAFASDAVARSESPDHVLYVEPVPNATWTDLGISKSTYYRYLAEAEGSGWIEKAGSFEYKTGERTEIGDAYLIVMKKDHNSP